MLCLGGCIFYVDMSLLCFSEFLYNKIKCRLKIQVLEDFFPHLDGSWMALHILWKKDWNPVSIMSQLSIFMTLVLWSAYIYLEMAPEGIKRSRWMSQAAPMWYLSNSNSKKKVTQTLKLVVLNFECRKPERMIFFVIIFNYCRCHSNTNNYIVLLN